MLRIGLTAKFAVIAAAALVGSGLAMAGAATSAFAVDNVHICNQVATGSITCAWASQRSGADVDMSVTHAPSPWNIDFSTSGTHQISYYSSTTGLCFTDPTTGSRRVSLADCAAASDQEWKGINLNLPDGVWEFKETAGGECLNYDVSGGYLNVATCSSTNLNEQFYHT